MNQVTRLFQEFILNEVGDSRNVLRGEQEFFQTDENGNASISEEGKRFLFESLDKLVGNESLLEEMKQTLSEGLQETIKMLEDTKHNFSAIPENQKQNFEDIFYWLRIYLK